MGYFADKQLRHRNFAVETSHLRNCFGMNRVQFAELLSITPRTVKRLEFGIVNPTNLIIRKYNSLLFIS